MYAQRLSRNARLPGNFPQLGRTSRRRNFTPRKFVIFTRKLPSMLPKTNPMVARSSITIQPAYSETAIDRLHVRSSVSLKKPTALYATLFLLVCSSTRAQVVVMKHQGGFGRAYLRDGIYAAWNPSNADDLLKPGAKVIFFGSSLACAGLTGAGPVAHRATLTRREAFIKTGLPLADADSDFLSPIADSKQCAENGQAQRPGSFVVSSLKNAGVGIGLYTSVGPDAEGRRPLLGPFDVLGQPGSGANVGIAGTFVDFRADWQNPKSLDLWNDASTPSGKAVTVLEIQTTQSLAMADLDVRVGEPDAKLRQVKQQLTVTFINRACRETRPQQNCQIQYLFTVAVVRSGVDDWSTTDWFKGGRIWIDPAQGNMPVIDGPIPMKGQEVWDAGKTAGLYGSDGDATAHGAFKIKMFRVSISFTQFQNAVRLATATYLGQRTASVSPGDVERFFGPEWNVGTKWTILSLQVGQEVYCPDPPSETRIGGSFRDISISRRTVVVQQPTG